MGWLALPGIGPYTAAAVASIALAEPRAALDGNAKRVLARLFAVRDSIDKPVTISRLTSLGGSLLSRRVPGAFNQAVMELGATVCRPKRPRCVECPLATWCAARTVGLQESLPVRRRRSAPRTVDAAAALIERAGRVILVKRPERGPLGGLWRLPECRVDRPSACTAALRRLGRELGLDLKVLRPRGVVEHAFTHMRMRLHVFECELSNGDGRLQRGGGARWVRTEDLQSYACSNLDRKALAFRGARECRQRKVAQSVIASPV
jgi:A/G-specific adenine glycosylase